MEELLSLLGFFGELPLWVSIGSSIILVLVLGYTGAPLLLWALAGYAALIGLAAPEWLFIVYTALVLLFNIKPLRRVLLSSPIMKLLDVLNFLPTISETEQTAIEAGTVWVEGELFSGKPDFKRILNEPYPELTTEEQAFLDGPVEKVCSLVNDWDVFVKKDERKKKKGKHRKKKKKT